MTNYDIVERFFFGQHIVERLKPQRRPAIDFEEAEWVLHLGLSCATPDTIVKPTMREKKAFFFFADAYVSEFSFLRGKSE